jgi:hypothetical protein
MRRHYGRYMQLEGQSELAKLDTLAPDLVQVPESEKKTADIPPAWMVRGGGLETQKAPRVVRVSAKPVGQGRSPLGMNCPSTDTVDGQL